MAENNSEQTTQQPEVNSENTDQEIKTIETGAPGEVFIDDRPENEIEPLDELVQTMTEEPQPPAPMHIEFEVNPQAVEMAKRIAEGANAQPEIIEEVLQPVQTTAEPEPQQTDNLDQFIDDVNNFRSQLPDPALTVPAETTDEPKPETTEPVKKNSINWTIIILMIGIVLVIIAAIAIAIKSNKQKQSA